MHKISFSGGISFGALPFVSALAEIQEAIEELAPEARLLDWLERFDADLEQQWVMEADQRFHELVFGGSQSAHAFEAIDEIRRQIHR
jgi:hypothetical protein